MSRRAVLRATGRTLLVLLAVLVVVAVVVLMGWLPREPLRRTVESALRSATSLGSSVRRVHIFPGGLRGELDGLVIDTEDYRLEIPRLEVGLRARMLFAGGVHTRFLNLYRPVLRIKAPKADAPPTPPMSLPVLRIAGIDLRDGTLIAELAGGASVETQGLRASGGVGEGSLELDLPRITWKRPDALDLGRATSRLTIGPDLRARLDELTYTKGQSQLRASGNLGPLTAMTPDLRFDGPLRLVDFAEAAAAPGLRGDVSLDGTLAGPIEAPVLKVKARGQGVGTAEFVTQSLDAEAEASSERYTARVDVSAFGGRAEATGSLDGQATGGRARITGVDFGALPKSAGIPPELRGRLSGDIRWDGALDGRVQVSSKLQTNASYKQPVTAQVEIAGGVFPKEKRLELRFTTTAETQGGETIRSGVLQAEGTAKGLWPPRVEGVAKVVASAAVGATTEPLEAESRFQTSAKESSVEVKGTFLGGTFEGGGRLVGSRVEDGRLTANAIELPRLNPALRGTGRLNLTASGPAAKPSLDLQLDLAGLAYEKADLGDAALTLAGTTAASRWTLNAPSLSLSGSGDLTSGKAGAVTGALTASGTSLAVFAPLAPAAPGLAGRASAAAQIRVPLSAPDKAEVAARFTELTARTKKYGPVTAQPFTIRYNAHRVELREFRATAAGASTAIDGDFGLDGSRVVAGTARLDVDLAAVEPKVENLAGTIAAELKFSGNATRPIVTGGIQLTGIDFARASQPHLRVTDGVVAIDDNVARFGDLKAEVDGGALVLAGTVPVPAVVASWRADPKRPTAEESADLKLSWDGFDAGAFLAALRPAEESPLQARLTGALTLRGGLGSVEEIDALLASQPATFAVGDVDGKLEGFEVRMTQGRVATNGIQIGAAGGTLQISGGAGVVNKDLDLKARGSLDLRVLSPIVEAASLTGTAQVDATVGGTFEKPDAQGRLSLDKGTARLRMMPQALTDIRADVRLEGEKVRIAQAGTTLGGGTISATCEFALTGATARTLGIDFKIQEVALRYPEGLRSRINGDLRLSGKPGAMLLAGNIRASRGLYDRDFQTASFLKAAPIEDSPAMRAIALNLNLNVRSPLRVRNDTARLEATGSMNIRGDMQTPAPYGRFEITTPGSELILLGARYPITQGTITYAGTWEPQVDIEVQRRIKVRRTGPSDIDTVAGEYVATVTAKGTTTDITQELLQLVANTYSTGAGPQRAEQALRFSAEGPGDLDSRDVASLLLTGRRQLSAGDLARTQAQSLVATQIARKLQKGLPFQNITIQPELVARESDNPETRFTFGAPITDGVDLTYSQSLSNGEDRLIQAEARTFKNLAFIVKREYEPSPADEAEIRNSETVVTAGDKNIVTVGAGQRLEWGGARKRTVSRGRRRQEDVKLTEVRLDGISDPALLKQAQDKLESEVGKKANTWTIQDDGDRVREVFLRQGYIDVEVSAQLKETVAILEVRPGRRYVYRIEGMSKPPDLTETLHASLYEEEFLEKGEARLAQALFDQGHLRAKIDAKASDEGDTRVLHFAVDPGPVLKLDTISFPGASALDAAALINAAGGEAALLLSPEDARTGIQKAYKDLDFPKAAVSLPQVKEAQGRVTVEVPIAEGRRNLITAIVFEGATRPERELLALSLLRVGTPYDPLVSLASVDALRNDYYSKGYPGARVHATKQDVPEGIRVTYHVNEGQKLTVGRVDIVGLARVREGFVRSAIDIKPGDPVDPVKLGRMERRLLALSVFSRVTSRFSEEDPSVVTVEVQEKARYAAGYDLRYNTTESQTAVVLDGEVRNLFGRGLGVGARYGVSQKIDEQRGTLFLPSILWRGDLTASVFRKTEDDFGVNPVTGDEDTDVNRLERGFQFQEAITVTPRSTVLFGYRFSRSTITSPFLEEPSEQSVAALNLSGLRDTRDNVLDARQGSFLSLSLSLAPKVAGSDQNFIKALAQGFFSVPISEKLTWAHGYRLGLAHVFADEPLVSFEGFKAGGANTIRGLSSDALEGVGPGNLFGAQGLLVVNQELRFRTDWDIGAAVFYDGGQIYETVKDFDFRLRHSVGVGLRYASAFGLVRLDVGFPLNRRRAEDGTFLDKKWQWYFSLGQAF